MVLEHHLAGFRLGLGFGFGLGLGLGFGLEKNIALWLGLGLGFTASQPGCVGSSIEVMSAGFMPWSPCERACPHPSSLSEANPAPDRTQVAIARLLGPPRSTSANSSSNAGRSFQKVSELPAHATRILEPLPVTSAASSWIATSSARVMGWVCQGALGSASSGGGASYRSKTSISLGLGTFLRRCPAPVAMSVTSAAVRSAGIGSLRCSGCILSLNASASRHASRRAARLARCAGAAASGVHAATSARLAACILTAHSRVCRKVPRQWAHHREQGRTCLKTGLHPWDSRRWDNPQWDNRR